jgi:hypothetical protein
MAKQPIETQSTHNMMQIVIETTRNRTEKISATSVKGREFHPRE